MVLSSPRRNLALAIGLAALVLASIVPAGVAAGTTAPPQEGVMRIPSWDNTIIDILVCKPAGASSAKPAPVVLHSHGWGGSRMGSCDDNAYVNAGIGVVSISQRGHGASGGQAHVHDPDYEGRDNIAVIDHIATLDWVRLDGPGDPVLGAIGGSYGGGYQFITAFTEIRTTGSTRLDGLAPDMTWHDLVQSLAPNGVIRSVWVAALYGIGAPNVHQGIHEAFAYGAATGNLPDENAPVYDIVSDFRENSPRAFVDAGYRLDIPALITQGVTDNLFNLNEGLANFDRAFTPAARAQSYFIGYNGGHALPNAAPVGYYASGNPCAAPLGGVGTLTLNFYKNLFFGDTNPMPANAYSIATPTNSCVRTDSISDYEAYEVSDVRASLTPSMLGAPIQVPVATGPLVVSGIPLFEADVTSLGLDTRVFLGMSVGVTPADARVIGNNLMPLRHEGPVDSGRVSVDLAGFAVEVKAGETLFLTVTPVSDMFVAHGSRTPGLVVLEDVEVRLPVVR